MSNTGRKDRPKQRDLIRWDSECHSYLSFFVYIMMLTEVDDKDIDVLLAIVKHCGAQKINIPWDAVGQEIGPRVTGNAVIQHLQKLRRKVDQGNTATIRVRRPCSAAAAREAQVHCQGCQGQRGRG